MRIPCRGIGVEESFEDSKGAKLRRNNVKENAGRELR
jgi:hypothetical protein